MRAEIWMIDLGMAAKPRPALVLSVNFNDVERAVVTYVARSTQRRGRGLKWSTARRIFCPACSTRKTSARCR